MCARGTSEFEKCDGGGFSSDIWGSFIGLSHLHTHTTRRFHMLSKLSTCPFHFSALGQKNMINFWADSARLTGGQAAIKPDGLCCFRLLQPYGYETKAG